MKAVLLFLCFFLAASTVWAGDNPYPVRRTLPKVPTTMIEDVPHKCFDTNQWQSILLLSNDYQGLYDWRLEITGTLGAYERMIEAYELEITNYKEIIKIKDKHIDLLTMNIEQLEKKHRNIALEQRLEKYILWAVVVIETLTIGIMGVKGLTGRIRTDPHTTESPDHLRSTAAELPVLHLAYCRLVGLLRQDPLPI